MRSVRSRESASRPASPGWDDPDGFESGPPALVPPGRGRRSTAEPGVRQKSPGMSSPCHRRRSTSARPPGAPVAAKSVDPSRLMQAPSAHATRRAVVAYHLVEVGHGPVHGPGRPVRTRRGWVSMALSGRRPSTWDVPAGIEADVVASVVGVPDNRMIDPDRGRRSGDGHDRLRDGNTSGSTEATGGPTQAGPRRRLGRGSHTCIPDPGRTSPTRTTQAGVAHDAGLWPHPTSDARPLPRRAGVAVPLARGVRASGSVCSAAGPGCCRPRRPGRAIPTAVAPCVAWPPMGGW